MGVKTTRLAVWMLIVFGLMSAAACSRGTDSTSTDTPDAPNVPVVPEIPSEPDNSVEIGGLDLNAYCKSIHQEGATLHAGNWACMPGSAPIDMEAACRSAHPDAANVFAIQKTQGDANTWSCFSKE